MIEASFNIGELENIRRSHLSPQRPAAEMILILFKTLEYESPKC